MLLALALPGTGLADSSTEAFPALLERAEAICADSPFLEHSPELTKRCNRLLQLRGRRKPRLTAAAVPLGVAAPLLVLGFQDWGTPGLGYAFVYPSAALLAVSTVGWAVWGSAERKLRQQTTAVLLAHQAAVEGVALETLEPPPPTPWATPPEALDALHTAVLKTRAARVCADTFFESDPLVSTRCRVFTHLRGRSDVAAVMAMGTGATAPLFPLLFSPFPYGMGGLALPITAIVAGAVHGELRKGVRREAMTILARAHELRSLPAETEATVPPQPASPPPGDPAPPDEEPLPPRLDPEHDTGPPFR